jgi:predicted secreted protein
VAKLRHAPMVLSCAVIVSLALILASCAQAQPTATRAFSPTATSQPPSPVATATIAQPSSTEEVVIVSPLAQQPIAVRVGQTLKVPNPGNPAQEWQVSFSPYNLVALTPAEQMSAPGPSGWRFKAIQPGEAQITLTSVVPPCRTTPCPPPMPQQFVIRLQVQP